MPFPSGEPVTFLFTDIEGSTRLWNQLPDQMAADLARHDFVLHATIGRHGGEVFKTIGDAFCAAFGDPVAAVQAALEAQTTLHHEVEGLRVRMAVHTGDAQPRDNDYFGPPLSHVARLLATGHGRQVLLSRATADLVRGHLPVGADLRPLGVHELRDIPVKEAIFQLQAPDQPTRFPPLDTLDIAFRRGVLRATTVAAVVLIVIGWLATVAVWNAARAAESEERHRSQLVRLNLETGARRAEDGDPFGALPYLMEAFRLDREKGLPETVHRVRLAATLRQCPKLLHLWFHNGAINSAEFSADGARVLIASDDGTAQVWDAATGAALGKVKSASKMALLPGGVVPGASFSPDGRRVLTLSDDRTVQQWDAVTGAPVGRALRHAGPVNQASFSPDGGRILTADGDGTARVWNAVSGEPEGKPLGHDGGVRAAVFSPDGARVITATAAPGNSIRIWKATGEPAGLPIRPGGGILAFSPDRRRVVAGAGFGARVWDVETGRPATPVLPHSHAVDHASFSPDGRRVVTASRDSTARVWDAATGAPVTPFLRHGSHVVRAFFSPDGRWVVTASWDRSARVWDAGLGGSGEPVWPPLPHIGAVTWAGFAPDGRRLLTTDTDGTARVWDLATDQDASRPLQEGGTVWGVAYSLDGRLLATANTDGRCRVWNAATGAPVTPDLRHPGASRVQFSPDGRHLLTAGGESARVWEVGTAAGGSRRAFPITPPLPQQAPHSYLSTGRSSTG